MRKWWHVFVVLAFQKWRVGEGLRHAVDQDSDLFGYGGLEAVLFLRPAGGVEHVVFLLGNIQVFCEGCDLLLFVIKQTWSKLLSKDLPKIGNGSVVVIWRCSGGNKCCFLNMIHMTLFDSF